MRRRRPALTLELSDAERGTLAGWLRATSTPLGRARRAPAILLLADGATYVRAVELTGLGERHVRKWARRSAKRRLAGLEDLPRPGRPPAFPPAVAMHAVKLACERPDDGGAPLSQWGSAEIARALEEDGMVERISAQTVRRILAHHKLKPWRVHAWLSAKAPRDAAFRR